MQIRFQCELHCDGRVDSADVVVAIDAVKLKSNVDVSTFSHVIRLSA